MDILSVICGSYQIARSSPRIKSQDTQSVMSQKLRILVPVKRVIDYTVGHPAGLNPASI